MQDKTLSIDKILLEQGLITPEQLTAALQYQCRLPRGKEMTLGEVLVALEYVSEEQLNEALGERPPGEDVLVQMLIKEGLIEADQLAEAMRSRGTQQESKRMGTVLLEMGYTTREMIETALKHYYLKHHNTEMPSYADPSQQSLTQGPTAAPAQQPSPAPAQFPPRQPEAARSTGPLAEEHVPIGQRLIRKGYINAEELEHALDYQQRLPRILHKPIGEILIMLGYLNQQQLEEVLRDKPAHAQLSLGDILVKAKVIEQWQLSHAMSLIEQPEHKGKKIGMLLVELGYARRPELEAALKEYYARQQARRQTG